MALMMSGKYEDETGQHPMEKDRDRSTGPSFVGIETHPHHIADNHHRKIRSPENGETRAQNRPRLGEIAAAASVIETDLSKQQDDQELTCQQRWIRHHT